jgi:hypothetical protein
LGEAGVEFARVDEPSGFVDDEEGEYDPGRKVRYFETMSF